MSVKAVFCLSLHQDYLACSSDLQEVLQQDPNVQEAEKELEEVTVLLRQSLANTSPAKPRKTVPITEVDTHVFFFKLIFKPGFKSDPVQFSTHFHKIVISTLDILGQHIVFVYMCKCLGGR